MSKVIQMVPNKNQATPLNNMSGKVVKLNAATKKTDDMVKGLVAILNTEDIDG